MRFGFLTAVLGDQPIAEVARWSAGAGFDALELHVGRHLSDPERVAEVIETVRGEGLEICALTFTDTLLKSDRQAAERAQNRARATVEAAIEFGISVVCTLPGRDETASEDDNYRLLAEYYGPLAERAAQGKVHLVLENWPGPRNDFLAVTPAGWTRLFQMVPAPNLGLNFDPSHLIRLGIDPEQALREIVSRVFLVHAKDTEIFADRLQQVGYAGSGWWTYRLPGHGRIDWRRWLALLREVGYDGAVSIEHEDRDWGCAPGGTDAQRRAGLVEGLRVLREAAVG